jgi:5'-methylthioadenosine phosphorylase
MSTPKIGIIGGTGIGDLLTSENAEQHRIQTPFGNPSDVILETDWHGINVLLLQRHGPGHTISPTYVPFRANIFALKQLGCTHIIATGACGSLRQEMKPRELVVPDQIIDRTYRRQGSFFERAAVHVEFAEPFCSVLRDLLIAEGKTAATPVHDRGCYVCMEGPAFSTRAESLMHRLWGGDLIGMTAMPEAKLAREAEIPYALLALVTDFDCWKPKPLTPGGLPSDPVPADPGELLKEIIGNVQAASSAAIELVRAVLKRIAASPESLAKSPASEALKLAIWSDKQRIGPEEIQKLSPLWGKYFG